MVTVIGTSNASELCRRPHKEGAIWPRPIWLAESTRLSKIYIQLVTRLRKIYVKLLNIPFTVFDSMMSYAGVNMAVFMVAWVI